MDEESFNVKKSMETKVFVIFETPTHSFKINEEKLNDMEGQYAELQSKIQKGLKQTIDVSRPDYWDASWKAIFKEITGQELLTDYDEKPKDELVEEN